jgi:hypothetical protein
MTRIMFWNINNFGRRGFFAPVGKRTREDDDPEYGGEGNVNEKVERILNVIGAVEPDIFSLAEVKPGLVGLAEGSVVQDEATYELMVRMREEFLLNYRVVPPIVTGTERRAEAIAVFYRADLLRFLGPFAWSGLASRSLVELGGAENAAQYGAPWNGAPASLPNREVPETWAVPTVGMNENRLAGQWQFMPPPPEAPVVGAPLPLAFPAAGFRKPFLTYFGEIEAPQRLIKLLSFHAPPDQEAVPPLSAAATATLAQIQEMTGAIPENEVRCVVGDFNVSSWNEVWAPVAYNPLTELGYEKALNPVAAGVEHAWPAYAYYTTHIEPRASASSWISSENGAEHHGYPGFSYSGSPPPGAPVWDAIDNAFVWIGGAAELQNVTIANLVTGSPYNIGPEHPEGVPQGAVALGTQMAAGGMAEELFDYSEESAWEGVPGNAMVADDVAEAFREWRNYWVIRKLSDHLPIVFDV